MAAALFEVRRRVTFPMMRYVVAVALAAVATACSSKERGIIEDPSADAGPTLLDGAAPAPSEDTHVSGTRLKRRVHKGVDGSQGFLGWYDSERDEPCSFAKAADGKLRCLPDAPTFSPLYYQDSQCKFRMHSVAAGCTAPKLLRTHEDTDQCAAERTTRVKFTTNKIAPQPTIYVGATCTPTPSPAGLEFYGVGAELSPGLFVEGAEARL